MLDGRVGIGLVPLLARGPIPLMCVLEVLVAYPLPGACEVGAPAAVPPTLMPVAEDVVDEVVGVDELLPPFPADRHEPWRHCSMRLN